MVDLGFRLLWTVFGKISLYCYIKELDYILPFWFVLLNQYWVTDDFLFILFIYLLATLCRLWDLSSLTKDAMHTLVSESAEP